MTEEADFLTLEATFSQQAVRQKQFVFTSRQQTGRFSPAKKTRPRSTFTNYENTLHSIWTPKIPSKRLFEEPKFFMALERKRVRILDGLRTISKFEGKQQSARDMKGRKVKQLNKTMRRGNSQTGCPDRALERRRSGWEPNHKTPYLNFNMQFWLKKRKCPLPSQPHLRNSPLEIQ